MGVLLKPPSAQRIIFASSYNQPSVWTDQIFTSALDGGALAQITSNNSYNEHVVWRPNGSAIVWMNTLNSPLGGTDWWMMAPDGTNAVQLTYFNTNGHAECTGAPQWSGLVTISPDGKSMLGGVGKNLIVMDSRIVRVDDLPAGRRREERSRLPTAAAQAALRACWRARCCSQASAGGAELARPGGGRRSRARWWSAHIPVVATALGLEHRIRATPRLAAARPDRHTS